MRTCVFCESRLRAPVRSDARFCSSRCRVAEHRRSGLAELRRRPRWVRWTSPRRGTARTKMPLTVAGGAASSTDPETWSSYRDAHRSDRGDGVGFVLNGDGIACLDLDHCITDGVVAPWAADVLDAVGRTYTEISPSGTGLHVWGRAVLPAGRVVAVPGGRVECYGTGRFITVTQDPYVPAPLADLSGFLRSIGVHTM